MKLPLSSKLKADAYLQWAFHTDFRYYRMGNGNNGAMLVSFCRPINNKIRAALGAVGLSVSDRYFGYRFASVTFERPDDSPRFARQMDAMQRAGAQYCELATPLAPNIESIEIFDERTEPGPTTVIGIIDDGCPFAHQYYRRQNANSLSVGYVWDQGGVVRAGPLGPVAPPFAYGAAYRKAHLDAIMLRASSSLGIDEDAAYGLSGLPGLRGATSHGSQVMSHAAGCARVARQPAAVPVPLQGTADIAFVQLPSDALDDPSGGWLDHYALDGLHAIRAYARRMHKTPAKTVIANLSYGPQTGPHDGTSILETAIDEMTCKACDEGYVFRVVLPSGNSHLARAHAEFDLARSGGTIEWFVSPDSQMPSFLEIWLPGAVTLDDVEVAITRPDALRVAAKFDSIESALDQTLDVVTVEGWSSNNQTMVLLALAPTTRPFESGVPAYPLATPGRYAVTVQMRPGRTVGAPATAHAYLARSDANMGRARRGRSGHLYSPGYDPNRYLRSDEQLNRALPNAPAEVVARGSSSGIATGALSAVAAGYCASERLPANYSSGGPSRGARAGPDWAYPTEESRVLAGRLGGGNRSAAVLRLSGTSTAAPQYARELAAAGGQPLPAPSAPPAPPAPWLTDRAGGGLRGL